MSSTAEFPKQAINCTPFAGRRRQLSKIRESLSGFFSGSVLQTLASLRPRKRLRTCKVIFFCFFCVIDALLAYTVFAKHQEKSVDATST
jgi:hypothetical protein